MISDLGTVHLTRILQLVQGMEIGGLEIMALNLTTHLDRSRFQPSICCFDVLGRLAAEARAKEIDVHFLKRKPGIDWNYPLKLARLLRDWQVDILHLHNPTAFFYGTLAGKIARTPCVIYTEHGRDVSQGWKVRVAHRILAKVIDHIVVVADYGKQFLITKEGVSEEKITRIYNGIDADRFDGERYAEERMTIRRSAGLDTAADPVVGIIARLDPIKNHAILIRAMKIVVSHCPKATLLVVGDGGEAENLRSLVDEMALGGHITFLGAREDIPDLLSIIDLFVLPSFSEGLSLTLIEACAAGKPVVATDVGGNSEVIEHGGNGLLVNSDDPEMLAGAMLEILLDPRKAECMGAKGRRKVEQQFTVESMVRRYEELYSTCMRCR